MNFRYRINLPDKTPPTRAYVHRTGLETSFGYESSDGGFDNAVQFLQYSLSLDEGKLRNFDYVLAILWGEGRLRTADFFGFANLVGNWPGNPEIYSWVVREGNIIAPAEARVIPSTQSTGITCGDSIILLGEEERYRRTKKSLDEYMTNPPNNPEIGNSTY